MESSEEEDDFPSFESITPQSKIDSLYQSNTEKGVRKICCELLDLKDAVENLCGDMQTKYLSFLRITEEVGEMEHELIELRKHISGQGILVQDLMSGVCCELEDWTKTDGIVDDAQKDCGGFDIQDPMRSETEDQSITFLEKIDVLLAEHKVEEAIDALEVEEKNSPVLKGLLDPSSADASSYKTAFLERKTILELQLVEITTQPFVGIFDVKKALCGLIKLGKGNLAHQLLLQFCGSRLERSIEAILRTSSMYPETYSATLSKLVFSMISSLVKESCSIFGDDPTYTNRIVQWAEWKIEYLVRLVKENAPASETIPALRAASICIQASLSLCSLLESQGLKLSKLLLVLLRPYIEEVLELNFRRARRVVLGLNDNDESFLLSPSFVSHLSTFATSSDNMLIESGLRFMSTVNDIVEQLTPSTVLHFGGNILSRISQLYGKFVDDLIKALPGPAEDENLAELKEVIVFRAETDSEKLALLGMAYTIADELLPETVIRSQGKNNENKESKTGPLESIVPFASTTTEYKDWKRQLQHSFDKLKDHFCMQYVLSFIYSREGNTRLDARIYLAGNMDNLSLGSDPMPSLPFQALFGKLQQLATVAGDVLLGKDKLQKILLARLTETVVMWLSAEQDFWNLFEDDSAPLHPRGLQQLMLDMHFTVEIARFAGYPSRNVHQIVSAIIARAITAFSARGLDPQSALLEDEWFVETAKAAINKLLSIASGSDVSDLDEDHIILDDEITSDSEGSPSSLSSIESVESFFSAENGEFGSPVYSDTES